MITGKSVSQELRERWEELVPNIIGVANEEDENANIQAMLSLSSSDVTDGKFYCA